jgi:hypothetical protein
MFRDRLAMHNVFIGGEEVVDIDPLAFEDLKAKLAEACATENYLKDRVMYLQNDVMDREA